MKNFLAASALLAATAFVAPAHANLILFDNPNQPNSASANVQSFVPETGIGFGADPRILTLQSTGQANQEVGSVSPGPGGTTVLGGGAISGSDKANTPTLSALGWQGGSQVAIGFNTNQTGNSGLTLNQLTLSVFNAANISVGSFSIASPIQFTPQDLALQQGNGQGIFVFVLDNTQRLAFDALSPSTNGNFRIGLSSDLGCATGAPASCQPSNSGAESFLAITAGTPVINPSCTDCPVSVPGPVVGAGLPGLVSACMGLLFMARRRRQRLA